MDEGSGEDLTLPRRVCDAEKLPGCIACKNFGAVERYFGLMHSIVDKFVGRTKYLFMNEQPKYNQNTECGYSQCRKEGR